MTNQLFFALCAMVCATGAAAQSAGYIAGLHPDRRPDDAPRLTEATRTPQQLEHALHGIEKPVPDNVGSIATTGNWWVPLRQSGMSAPYDLRGWYSAATEAAVPVGAASTDAQLTR